MTKKPIRILHVTRSVANNGGIEEYLRLLASRLDPEVFQLGICSLQDSPEEVLPCFHELGVKLYCGNRRASFLNPFAAFWTGEVIRDFAPDIVHTHTDKGNFHGRLAAGRAKVPVITTHHDLEDIAFSRSPEIKRKFRESIPMIERSRAPFVDSKVYPFLNVGLDEINAKVVCVCDAIKQIHTKDSGDKRFLTIYASYDDTLFRETYCGLEKEDVTLGIVGRLVPPKGHAVLMKAVAELRKKGFPVSLRVIGDGLLREQLETLAKELRIEKGVAFCGDMPHSHELYEGIDIYLQPSFLEGCSITLSEAMATGIPVIVTDSGGPGEMVQEGETGLVVPPGNSHAITEAVTKLLQDRTRAKEMGKAAAKRARSLFSSTAFIEKMSALYREVE